MSISAYRILVGNPEGKRPLGRPRRRWEDNIIMDIREIGWVVWTHYQSPRCLFYQIMFLWVMTPPTSGLISTLKIETARSYKMKLSPQDHVVTPSSRAQCTFPHLHENLKSEFNDKME
jgi:hypothetical protein